MNYDYDAYGVTYLAACVACLAAFCFGAVVGVVVVVVFSFRVDRGNGDRENEEKP